MLVAPLPELAAPRVATHGNAALCLVQHDDRTDTEVRGVSDRIRSLATPASLLLSHWNPRVTLAAWSKPP